MEGERNPPPFCGMRYVGTRIPPAENERSQLLLLSWIEREREKKKDFFPFSCFALKKRKVTNELSHYLFYREENSETAPGPSISLKVSFCDWPCSFSRLATRGKLV